MRGRLLIIGAATFAVLTTALFLGLSPTASAHHNGLPPSHEPEWESVLQATMLVTGTQSFTSYLPAVANVNCRVGSMVDDPPNDVIPAHIDLTQMASQINSGWLTVMFYLRDVPATLPFYRPGIPRMQDGGCWLEYSWNALVDVDNSPATGWNGYDYWLTAMSCPGPSDALADLPIEVGTKIWVGRWDSTCGGDGCFRMTRSGTIAADSAADTITIEGPIPGATGGARLGYYTFDYNPGGPKQTDFTYCGPHF